MTAPTPDLVAALEALVRRVVREEVQPPVFVTQRNVEQVVGLHRREYLAAARRKDFPTTKEGRRVIARTADVIAFYDERIALREAPPVNDAAPEDPEAVAFAKVGARRVRA
ncbi:MAG TPA: hypothetical protein VIY73_20430 [Polyangiaceae bacterium]